MRYRLSAPESMIPFHIAFRGHVDSERLVEMAQVSAKEDKTPVLVVIQPDGIVYGAIHPQDSYFQTYHHQSHYPVTHRGEFGAELMTGFAMSKSGSGLLVIPHIRPARRPPTNTSLPLVLGRWCCEFIEDEVGDVLDVILVCGRYQQRKFLGPKFVVETTAGLIAMVRMPDSPDALQEYFAPLSSELGIKECWAHCEDMVYHLQW